MNLTKILFLRLLCPNLVFLSDPEVIPQSGNTSQLRLSALGVPGQFVLKVKAQDNGGLDLGGIDTTCFEIYVKYHSKYP